MVFRQLLKYTETLKNKIAFLLNIIYNNIVLSKCFDPRLSGKIPRQAFFVW